MAASHRRKALTPAEALRCLRRIRREAQALLAAGAPPALAQTLREIDRAGHLAAWQIGEAASLLAESDLPATPPPRRGDGGATRRR